MSIVTARFAMVANNPPILIRSASGAEVVTIKSNSSGVYIGPSGFTILDGFQLKGSIPMKIGLANNDEIWALSTTKSIVEILVET